MTFEKLSQNSGELYRQIEVPNSYALMTQTSLQLRDSLKEIYDRIPDADPELAVAVFGSPARYEMLPYSDVDLLVFCNPKSEKSVQGAHVIIQNAKGLPYDKVDTPVTVQTPEDLLAIAHTNSPDAHMADCDLVVAHQNFDPANDIEKSKAALASRRLENVVFGYYFLTHRAKLKESPEGVSLKYSPGGTRDFLYLDWAADYITDGETATEARRLGCPQLQLSLPILMQALGRGSELGRVEQAVHFLNACKNAALELAHHGLGVFDGLMGNRTAASIVENYQFSSDVTSTEMITAHEQARGVIRQLKDEIFDHIVSSSLRGVATAGTDADLTARLKIINEVWRNEISEQDKHSVYEELIASSDWAAVTTVTCQDDATPTQLHKITEIARDTPGYEFTLRLVIQHPHTPAMSLVSLLAHPRLATDIAVDAKYRKMLRERLALN